DHETKEWLPPILKGSASEGAGVEELLAACERHLAFVVGTDEGKARRKERLERYARTTLREILGAKLEAHLGQAFDHAVACLARGEEDRYSASERLVQAALGAHQ